MAAKVCVFHCKTAIGLLGRNLPDEEAELTQTSYMVSNAEESFVMSKEPESKADIFKENKDLVPSRDAS